MAFTIRSGQRGNMQAGQTARRATSKKQKNQKNENKEFRRGLPGEIYLDRLNKTKWYDDKTIPELEKY